MNKKGRNVEFN